MRRPGEIIAGLLERGERAWANARDWTGDDRLTFHKLRGIGALAPEPLLQPSPTCPYCGLGAPHAWSGRIVCDECQTILDPVNCLVWPFHADRFFRWFSRETQLKGTVAPLCAGAWQLGCFVADQVAWECFYAGTQPHSSEAWSRLRAYRNVLLIRGSIPEEYSTDTGRQVLLANVLGDFTIDAGTLPECVRPPGRVRFDPTSGGVWTGSILQGEVSPGSREYYLLARLAAEIDHYVAYGDLKQFVLRESRSRDQTDEATFCQRLKSRIKKHAIPAIDRLIVTSNKGDGYRLRGYIGKDQH